jgi:acetylglutamate kinase
MRPQFVEYSALETLLNGAGGFTYYAYWDFDNVLDYAAMAKALRMIAPYENLIMDGELVEIPVNGVNTSAILEALAEGKIPVVTPLGTGADGNVYNINADTAASKIAEALHARKLVFVSDVPGVLSCRDDENSVIPTIRTTDIPELIRSGVLSGGMLPKVQGCVKALESGINKVHMINGRIPHALLLEIFTEDGVGTQIVRPDSRM